MTPSESWRRAAVRGAAALVAAASTSLGGCQPKIDPPTISPGRFLCQGDTATLRTTLRGALELGVTLGAARPAAPGAPDTVRLELTATKGARRSATERVALIVSPAQFTTPLVFSVHENGPDSLAASASFTPADWPASIRIRSIAASRALRVAHLGRVLLLAPNAPDAGLEGLPVSGDWTLAGARSPGEAAPRHFTLDVAAACVRGS